ncbi:unnamed protein product [Caenorhabditis bovis]|uniref:Uncharacterized protein n=1 Tax=Caenorhabditis bovis TaxID=2654633 RepID=A0A8S1FBD9_9PELO|nr:unnamed protein product [Caenorhabditis bovis]
MSDMSMKKVIEVEDAVEVGPPRKRVKFYHFAEEVLFEVVEGPRKGLKRTRMNGPEIRKVKAELNESPAKRRRPQEVSQEEMLAAFGTDAEPVELDMTPHSYFCYRYCVAGCGHDCLCRKDLVRCCPRCPCNPRTCTNYDLEREHQRRSARASRAERRRTANREWAAMEPVTEAMAEQERRLAEKAAAAALVKPRWSVFSEEEDEDEPEEKNEADVIEGIKSPTDYQLKSNGAEVIHKRLNIDNLNLDMK